MKPKPLPPVAVILRDYVYDPVTGIFCHARSKRGRRRKDGRAGSLTANGYVYLLIDGERYLAHRLAWKLSYGTDPVLEIDHKDTNRQNNAIANLRPADSSQQSWNSNKPLSNTSGLKGAFWQRKKKHWYSQIIVRGQRHYLGGGFRTAAEAHAAYVAGAQQHFREFANAG